MRRVRRDLGRSHSLIISRRGGHCSPASRCRAFWRYGCRERPREIEVEPQRGGHFGLGRARQGCFEHRLAPLETSSKSLTYWWAMHPGPMQSAMAALRVQSRPPRRHRVVPPGRAGRLPAARYRTEKRTRRLEYRAIPAPMRSAPSGPAVLPSAATPAGTEHDDPRLVCFPTTVNVLKQRREIRVPTRAPASRGPAAASALRTNAAASCGCPSEGMDRYQGFRAASSSSRQQP